MGNFDVNNKKGWSSVSQLNVAKTNGGTLLECSCSVIYHLYIYIYNACNKKLSRVKVRVDCIIMSSSAF